MLLMLIRGLLGLDEMEKGRDMTFLARCDVPRECESRRLVVEVNVMNESLFVE